ncbi:MAG: serine/threonine protein kinase, partial [Alphaproteobacteria bacterium]|nr:serine/threonine protein kinase [Alphaproteobacteria bacterium]
MSSWGSRPPSPSTADAWDAAAVEVLRERYSEGLFLGEGGMGEVHSVCDLQLDRVVARKVVRDPTPGAEARLLREARVTARLDHPGVVPVHDVGRLADGRLYYTMRLVRGRTLEAALPGLARTRALRHLLDVCATVAYAHEQGVVHRDLKATNILVGAFGETQVADWGLAVGPGEPGSGVVGTPETMSPEVVAGRPADTRSDVWALGCLLVHIVLGRPPFGRGDDAMEALRTGPPSPPDLDDPELTAVARRALCADPADRYPSASAFAEDLEAWLDGRPVGAYAYSMPETLRRFAWAWRGPLAGVLAVLAVGAGATAWNVRATALERDRAVLAESRALEALREARSAEARALLARALDALAAEDRPTAEILAARSLVLSPTPEARGVLAAWWGVARPERVERRPLACDRTQLLDGGVVCFVDDRATVDGVGFDHLRSVHRLPDGSLAVVRLDDTIERWADGALTASAHVYSGRVAVVPDRLELVRVGQARANRVDLRTGEVIDLDVCAGNRGEAILPGRDGTLWVGCADGRVERLGPEPGGVQLEIPDGFGLVSALATVDGRVVAGTLHGGLVGEGSARRVFDGSVLDVLPSPDGGRLLVRSVAGELAVVDARTLQLVVRLPGRASDAGWADDRTVRTVGTAL